MMFCSRKYSFPKENFPSVKCNNRKLAHKPMLCNGSKSIAKHFERVCRSVFQTCILSAYHEHIQEVPPNNMGHWQRFLHPFPWRNNLWDNRPHSPEYVTLIDNISNVITNYTSTQKASINALIWIHSTARKWLSQWKDGLPSNITVRFLHRGRKNHSPCWGVLHRIVHLPTPLFQGQSILYPLKYGNMSYNFINWKRWVRNGLVVASLIIGPKYVVYVLHTRNAPKPRAAPKTQGPGLTVLPDV